MILKIIGFISILGFTFVSGFVIGRLNIPTPFNDMIDVVTSDVTENQTATTTTTTVPTHGSTGTSIDIASKLTDSQRKMLESFGLNPDTIVITPAIISCAEAKVGKDRMAEIQNGATPSFLEGTSLVACYTL